MLQKDGIGSGKIKGKGQSHKKGENHHQEDSSYFLFSDIQGFQYPVLLLHVMDLMK